ncbi:MAG: bifunctional UDP-N-acetylglucosamine diphosphorylase/glucosamine-1-phosphate N-acetyltransferase GlmU, partial [Rhodospirillales bacterium]|nr:bifunctional UDP-N-acetylglucosamine diphosphorylase/glucosamine-1-phosphate N-acetyltransferase GlmU [Rhodospirillales bacterium]
MNIQSMTAIITAAGLGTRMKSSLPKVMHPIASQPMICSLINTLQSAGVGNICAVISENMDMVADAVAPHKTAIQYEPMGTGHAVLSAKAHIETAPGDILTVSGSDPLITQETFTKLMERRQAADNPAVVVLGFRSKDPGLYGRLITNDEGELGAIVEARDASPEQLAIDLCNGGTMAIDGSVVLSMLERIGNDNAKSEYYLTDLIKIARDDGRICAFLEVSEEEQIGVDTRADLAQAEAIMQQRLRSKALDGGATLIAPDTVTFSHDTVLGKDVVVEPNVFFGPGVAIGDNVTIKGFSHLEGCTVKDGATLGPYARLRPGASIGERARVGNFVEIKNAELGTGAKANHLSYIGDSTVGANANIGAGTITCNYDGFNKSHTVIGEGAFIGSNTALVAPVTVGDGAIIGAGSTITKNAEPDSLTVTRAEQKSITG